MNNKIEKPQGSYISYFSNLVKKHGGINLAQGIPGFDPPLELRNELSQIVNDSVHQYAPGVGNFELLNLLHENYSQLYNVDKDNFLIVQGATEALSLIYTYLLQKIGSNFSVLSFEPAYESYSKLPAIFGQSFVGFDLNELLSFDINCLRETVLTNSVKIIFVSSPGNPFGKIWSENELNSLVELCNDFGIYLIFDAVYKNLYFHNPPNLPLNNFSPNIFYVNSFSKMLCITGWRIGYLYAHADHRFGLRSIHDYIGLCAPSLLQQALANYLRSSNFGDHFIERYRNDVRISFDSLSCTLSKLGFMIPKINGGCFIWAKLPPGIDDGFTFAQNLYTQKGVAIIPGEHFSSKFANWVRFNIARPFHEIEKAGLLISEFLSNP
jgi:aspartate/methionine/tyrosine aminotransferase